MSALTPSQKHDGERNNDEHNPRCGHHLRVTDLSPAARADAQDSEERDGEGDCYSCKYHSSKILADRTSASRCFNSR